MDDATGFGALVVLGAHLKSDGTPGRSLLERLKGARAVWETHPSAWVVFTGHGPGTRPEADAMADWAAAQGLSPDRIIRERRSANTAENAAFTAAILRSKGVSRVALVTETLHSPRAARFFERQGLSVVNQASVPSPTLARMAALGVHEMLAPIRSWRFAAASACR